MSSAISSLLDVFGGGWTMTYNCPLFSVGATFQDAQWVPENTDSTEPRVYTVISLYVATYHQV